jgi:predicted phage terminase large subunit-like protein
MARPSPPKSVREKVLVIVQELIERKQPVPEKYLAILRSDDKITDFRSFIKLVKPSFEFVPHVERMIDNLQKVFDGEITHLMIWCPPRLGKSELVSRLFSAYYLLKNPKREVMLVSHAASLADSLSLQARSIYTEAGGRINPDARAKNDWRTAEGGGMVATGVGGNPLGRGCHLLLVDDYHGRTEHVQSESIRESGRAFWHGVLKKRLNRFGGKNTATVIVMQRWSDEDICGWLLSQSGGDEEKGIEPIRWHVVAFDGIKSEEAFKVPDWCTLEPDWRQPGEALAPVHYPLQEMLQEQHSNPWYFAAQIQQRPQSMQGQLCNSSHFKTISPAEAAGLPEFANYIRGWDIASSEGKGDWTVGALIGVNDKNELYILDVQRERLSGPDVRELIKKVTLAERPKTIIAVEKAGVGLPIFQELMRDRGMAQFPLMPVTVSGHSGNLANRAIGLFSKVKNGLVSVVSAPWTPTLISEFVDFGNTKHDDILSAVNIAHTIAVKIGIMGQQAPPEEDFYPGTIGWYRQMAGQDPYGNDIW